MLTTHEARLRVARGAALLDQLVPHWAYVIDPELLQLDSCGSCVLGQLYGDYLEAYSAIQALPGKGGTHYGFDITASELRGLRHANYSILTDAWREAISERIQRPASLPGMVETGEPVAAACSN
jgi:hypothetical protein